MMHKSLQALKLVFGLKLSLTNDLTTFFLFFVHYYLFINQFHVVPFPLLPTNNKSYFSLRQSI
eukprot:m.40268 g.40268  ORF g.40268 m.40268 type:complete len:63 (-) comp6913_c1_seq1:1797-1985(-)